MKRRKKRMRKNKVGSLFLMSVLALAGIGFSYAGFSDSISVYGTVDTATLNTEIMTDWYSGTWVYKIYSFEGAPPILPPGDPDVYDLANEVLIYRGFVGVVPAPVEITNWADANGGHAELEAYSYAYDNTPTTDIGATYYNLFPCIDFSADFIFHYTGSIPGRINTATIFPTTEDPYPGDGVGFLTYLWNYHINNPTLGYGAWVKAYLVTPTGDPITEWTVVEPVDVGYQLTSLT
jgi:hypothetical protein